MIKTKQITIIKIWTKVNIKIKFKEWNWKKIHTHWSGKLNVPDKNLVVSVTSSTFPPKNPLAVESVNNPKNILAKNLLTDDQPIKIDNNFISNQINLTTKSLINLPSPTDLSIQNPKQNLTLKTLHVINVTRKDIHPVFARSIPNFMSSK